MVAVSLPGWVNAVNALNWKPPCRLRQHGHTSHWSWAFGLVISRISLGISLGMLGVSVIVTCEDNSEHLQKHFHLQAS